MRVFCPHCNEEVGKNTENKQQAMRMHRHRYPNCAEHFGAKKRKREASLSRRTITDEQVLSATTQDRTNQLLEQMATDLRETRSQMAALEKSNEEMKKSNAELKDTLLAIKDRPVLVHVWGMLNPIQTLDTLDFRSDVRFEKVARLKYSSEYFADRRAQQEYREKARELQSVHPTSVKVAEKQVFYLDGSDGYIKEDREDRVAMAMLKCFANNADGLAGSLSASLRDCRSEEESWRREKLLQISDVHLPLNSIVEE